MGAGDSREQAEIIAATNASLLIACPTCGAPALKQCRTRGGRLRPITHKARWDNAPPTTGPELR